MKRLCHHDTPEAEVTDDGAAMRARAAESCGYGMGQDLEASRAELERNGGPESVVKNAIKRAERGDR